MRIAREVTLRLSAHETSPVAVGVFRAGIVLPDAATSWDDDRRRAVLLHELAHIQRGDCRVQAIAQAVCVLYWFNPLAWMASSALRRERERACDDAVLRYGMLPSTYATHLIEIARGLRRVRQPTAALAMARPSELEGRLLSVLATGRARVPARATRWIVAPTLGSIALLILGASATDPAVATTHGASGLAFRVPLGQATIDERVDTARTVARAREALDSPDPHTREQAAIDLMRTAQPDTVRPLTYALADRDAQVREKAALGLGLLSTPDVITPLLQALRDPSAQVREKAALGLALRRDARVVEPLIAAMGDPDSQVREKAAIALGTSGDARALPALERALSDPDPQVREKAVTAITLVGTMSADGAQGERVRDGLRHLVSGILNFAR